MVATAALNDEAAVIRMPLSRAQMLRAFLRSDSAAEGLFFAGVKTTAIFCRPTCRARKPRPENIEFFLSATEAQIQGYRPCKLCCPTDAAPRPPALVERLRLLLEQNPAQRLTDKELVAMSIEPSTARRQFRRYFGVTFQTYQRHRRLGLALSDLQHGARVIDAQIARGFDSASGFRTAFSRVFGTAPRGAQDAACLFTRQLDTPLGPMLAVASDAGLHVLDFVDRRGLPRRLELLGQKLHSTLVPGEHPNLVATAKQLAEYFSGQRLNLTLPLSLLGSPWERTVWAHLKTIPPGETKTYAQLAAEIGCPSAPRAVGRANGANFLEVALPCHRVIRADGSLCGYGGGLWRKQWLLNHERKFAASLRPSKPVHDTRQS